MGGMTDELDGCYITEFTSNGAKTYGYKTSDGEQVLKCKGFTLNKITSDKITLNVMKDLAEYIAIDLEMVFPISQLRFNIVAGH